MNRQVEQRQKMTDCKRAGTAQFARRPQNTKQVGAAKRRPVSDFEGAEQGRAKLIASSAKSDGVLFVERSGELRYRARLRT